MDQMLSDVGAILLRAIPTFILVIFLFFYLRAMFFRPLEKVLAERRAATEGARKQAQTSIELAEAKVAQYEAQLRAARSEVFAKGDAERKQWTDAQAAQIAAAREKAIAQVREARAQIARDTETARATLGAQAETLAAQITASVLKGA
jgi:F-type H+-transporting ATPase subunit b